MKKIITSDELRQNLPLCSYCQVNDKTYILPTDSNVLEILTMAGVWKRKYQQELFDCEDFALAAKVSLSGNGWPIAVMKILRADTDTHYIIGWLNINMEWRDYEPQTNQLYTGKILRRTSIII